jgi:CheY-like chemotaxis protein
MKFETVITDDDEMVIFLHKLSVVESGLCEKPVIAYNGTQAFQYIATHANDSFLILLDLNMPEMDGWQFLDAIQKIKDTRIYVVVVTSSVDARDRKKAYSYPQVIDYVEKPLSIENCLQIKNHVTALS